MKISILGRIGYDLYAEEHGVPLKDVTRFSRYLGGSSANAAVGLSRLGLETGMISCLGTDALSDYLLEYLQAERVNVSRVQRREGFLPSFCLTEVSPPSDFPQVFYRQAPADSQVEVETEDLDFIQSTHLFVSNGTSLSADPARSSTFRAMEWARDHRVKVAFDVDYRAMSWKSPEEAGLYTRLALPAIDILIANPEELCLVAQEPKLETAIERLRSRKMPLLVAKLGSEGTKVFTPDEAYFLRPFPVRVISTIGAGDGFASGFLYAVVKGLALPEALRYGNAAAAIVVSRLMCSEAMPRLTELEAFLQEHSDIVVEDLDR